MARGSLSAMRDDAFEVLTEIVAPRFAIQVRDLRAFGADFGWRDGMLVLTIPAMDASGEVVRGGPDGMLSYRPIEDGGTVVEIRWLPDQPEERRTLVVDEIKSPLVTSAIRDFVLALGWDSRSIGGKPFPWH